MNFQTCEMGELAGADLPASCLRAAWRVHSVRFEGMAVQSRNSGSQDLGTGPDPWPATHRASLQTRTHCPPIAVACFIIWLFVLGQTIKNLPAVQETWVHSWVGKISWTRAWQCTPVLLPRESMGRGAWWATVHGVVKSWTRLSD